MLSSSLPTTHPVRPEVLLTLQHYIKSLDSSLRTLFLNERSDQFDRSSTNYLPKILSKSAGLSFSVNPHMLRHGCGYALANMGQDTRLIQGFLGHKSIQHAVIYRCHSRAFLLLIGVNLFQGFRLAVLHHDSGVTAI